MDTKMQTQGCVICGHSVSRLWLKDCPDYYLGTPYRVDYAELAATFPCGTTTFSLRRI